NPKKHLKINPLASRRVDCLRSSGNPLSLPKKANAEGGDSRDTLSAIAASQWSQTLGAVFSVAITVGVFGTLAIAIRRVHQFSVWRLPLVFLSSPYSDSSCDP
ncbi:MAG: hypothetical protein RLP02_26640, partial [Coleofasciculus sp. C2-GNP5-27]